MSKIKKFVAHPQKIIVKAKKIQQLILIMIEMGP